MCARFTLTAPAHDVATLFDLLPPPVEPRFNVAPTQQILVCRSADGGREFAHLRWGLVPFWATDLKIGNKLLNARSETVAEKPSFRDAFKKRRCLVAADGYYEWRTEGKLKQPYHIHFRDRKPFAFAGLWERWEDEQGEVVETCTIVTTAANKAMEAVHDRMPVIVAKDDFPRWLDHRLKKEQVEDIFASKPSDGLEMFKVTPKVNKPGYHEPDCVAPI